MQQQVLTYSAGKEKRGEESFCISFFAEDLYTQTEKKE